MQAVEELAVLLGAALGLAVGRLGRARVVLGRRDLVGPRRRSRRRWRCSRRAGRRARAPRSSTLIVPLDVDARVVRGVGHRLAHVDLRGQVEDHVRLHAADQLAHGLARRGRRSPRAARRSRAPARGSRACPVERLSSTVTSSPRASSASTRFEPMKPAPPVTSAFMRRRILECAAARAVSRRPSRRSGSCRHRFRCCPCRCCHRRCRCRHRGRRTWLWAAGRWGSASWSSGSPPVPGRAGGRPPGACGRAGAPPRAALPGPSPDRRCWARASLRRCSGLAERPTLSPEIEFASRPMPTAARRPAMVSAATVAKRLKLISIEASPASARTRQAEGQALAKRARPPGPPRRALRPQAGW